MHVRLFLFWPVYAHFFHCFLQEWKIRTSKFDGYTSMLQINPPPRVNCLKEKLTTLVNMIVFLKHDQLIQTGSLIKRIVRTLWILLTATLNHLRVPNFIRHLHISHNAPCSPSNLYNLCFSFVLGITVVQRKIRKLAKFLGANKVHYGICASSEFMCRYGQTLS